MRLSPFSLRELLLPGRTASELRSQSRQELRRRRHVRNGRIKAILAGGLVLGVGATATLASWTDSENADGTFDAGSFGVELSVDGSWGNTREMTFQADSMYPGATVYAAVFVRTTATTTIDGQLTVSGGGIGNPNSLAAALTYRTVTRSITTDGIPTFACDESAFSGGAEDIFDGPPAGSELSVATSASVKQELAAAGASVQAYCFAVTLPEDASNGAQGQSAKHTWTFDAESTPPGL